MTTEAQNAIKNRLQALKGVTTIGYINIMAKNRVQMTKGMRVKVFASKSALKLARLAIMAKQKANEIKSRLFNQCWLQAGIFDAKINQCKKALKDARKQMLTTLEYFVLHVNLAKAYLHLRTFKLSLPKQIVNLLF